MKLLTWCYCHKVWTGAGGWQEGDAGGPVAYVAHRLLHLHLVLPEEGKLLEVCLKHFTLGKCDRI